MWDGYLTMVPTKVEDGLGAYYEHTTTTYTNRCGLGVGCWLVSALWLVIMHWTQGILPLKTKHHLGVWECEVCPPSLTIFLILISVTALFFPSQIVFSSFAGGQTQTIGTFFQGIEKNSAHVRVSSFSEHVVIDSVANRVNMRPVSYFQFPVFITNFFCRHLSVLFFGQNMEISVHQSIFSSCSYCAKVDEDFRGIRRISDKHNEGILGIERWSQSTIDQFHGSTWSLIYSEWLNEFCIVKNKIGPLSYLQRIPCDEVQPNGSNGREQREHSDYQIKLFNTVVISPKMLLGLLCFCLVPVFLHWSLRPRGRFIWFVLAFAVGHLGAYLVGFYSLSGPMLPIAGTVRWWPD
jgi:hypothetical protein